MNTIYRYTSFESFVDTILRKKLTFVHPSLWGDPYELYYVHQDVKNQFQKASRSFDPEFLGALAQYMLTFKLYAQSWTSLDESDALWRIYSHNGTSVRIAVKREKVKLLEGVEIIDVEYVDCYEEVVRKKKDFYGLIGTKRKAFSHENEIRLVTQYKFSSKDEIMDHMKAFWTLMGNTKEFIKNVKLDGIEVEPNKLVQQLNLNIQDKIHHVSFDGIDNFIDSVMLNPFAPEWVNETLKLFCKNNNLRYLGKSTLYNNS